MSEAAEDNRPLQEQVVGRDEMRKREDDALTAFCESIAILDGEPGRIRERPDRDLPGQGGCEAIILRGAGLWAVEHTTFDSFEDQRLDNARLRAALDPATIEIAAAFPEWEITIGVPPGAVRSGVAWAGITKQFATSVIANIRKMSDSARHTVVALPDLFEVTIFRHQSTRNPRCSIVRNISRKEQSQLSGVIERSLRKKEQQLAPYAARGLETLLLLENDDIAQMEPYAAAEAFRQAASRIQKLGIDEVYIVDGTIAPAWIYPVKLGARINPLPEFRQFQDAQFRRTYGEP